MSSMVVCPEPSAAAAGERILAAGGNAYDAAIAASFCQCVTNPLLCGVGGTSIVLCTSAGQTRVLNAEAEIGSGDVPASWSDDFVRRSETIGRFIVRGEPNQIGAPSVMVPGFVSACWRLFNERGSGRLTWRQLLEPAIRTASDGFVIYPYVAGYWSLEGGGDSSDAKPGYPSFADKLSGSVPAQEVLLKPDGSPYVVGDVLRQTAYAETLDQLATAGGDDFYTGEIARVMASDLAAGGSLVRDTDLAGYRTREQEPLSLRVGETTVLTSPPPTPGVQVLQMLGILSRIDGLAARDDARTIDTVCRVMRAGFADNAHLKGMSLDDGPAHAAEVLDERRLSEFAARIASGDRMNVRAVGPADGTTHVTVVDSEHDVVSMTHSLGSIAGSGSMAPELGFLYNNFLGHFDPRPGHESSILPGRRIGSGVPTVVYRDGELVTAMGAPGGSRLITAVFQVLADMLIRGHGVETAVALPRVHSEEHQRVYVEPSFSPDLHAALDQLGNDTSVSTYMSRVQAIAVERGRLVAGADPRGGAGIGIVHDVVPRQ